MDKTNFDINDKLLLFLDAVELQKGDIFTLEFKVVLNKFEKVTSDIFSSSEFFEDFPEKTFLWEVFELIKTKDDPADVDGLLEAIEKLANESKDYIKEEIYVSSILLLYIYLKESVFGPSFDHIKETEKIDHEKELSLFENSVFRRILKTYDSDLAKDSLNKHLTIEGESPYRSSKLVILFAVAKRLISSVNYFDTFPINYLWKARVSYLHNKMIKEPINSIQQSIFDNLNKFELEGKEQVMKNLDKDTSAIVSALLKIEKSYICLKYYKYAASEDLLDSARKELNLKIELTGRLGRLTKYQEFDSTILVVDSQSGTLNTSKVDQLINEDNAKAVTLDEVDDKNVLLEKPNFTDDKFLTSSELSLYDQVYVCGYLNLLKKSYPDEDILRSIINAYLSKSIEKSYDWLVFSKMLIFKSFNEDKRTKTVERSLVQIQSICEQFNDRKPGCYQRLKNFFFIDYPYIWDLKKQYAEMYMQFGAVLTAFETFKELEMFEECVQCLYIAGKNQSAIEFAEQVMKKKEDPGIYCVLGEMQNKVEFFYKALEISKGGYTRAYRCLGKYYFLNKDLDKAIENYTKALKINPLFPNVWFTLGCIHIQKGNWEDAIKAFSSSVQIDDTQGECWANLASAFNQLRKTKEAIKCLENGFKQSRTNWKICENLMLISLDSGDINKALSAMANLFALEKYERVQDRDIYKLIKEFLTQYPTMQTYQKTYFKKKIYGVFETFTQKDGINPNIWDLYAFYIESIEIKFKKYEQKEEKEVKEGDTEKLSLEELKIRSDQEDLFFYKQIVEIRLKQCRTYLIPEWDKDDKQMDIILKGLEKLEKDLEKISDKDYVEDKKQFVATNRDKITRAKKKMEFDKMMYK